MRSLRKNRVNLYRRTPLPWDVLIGLSLHFSLTSLGPQDSDQKRDAIFFGGERVMSTIYE